MMPTLISDYISPVLISFAGGEINGVKENHSSSHCVQCSARVITKKLKMWTEHAAVQMTL